MREIHYAAARGDLETVLEELRAGADVNHQDPEPLNSSEPIDLKALLEGEGFELTEEEERIHEAVQSIDWSQFGEKEVTPMILAAGDSRADCRMLECLLEHGADVNRMGGAAETCALGEALRGGDLGKVRLLLKHGADPGYVTLGGTGAWVDAAYCRTDTRLILPELLAKYPEADPERETSFGEHAARVAARRGDFELLGKLLDCGVKRAALGWTDLMWELVFGSEQSVRAVLEVADLDARDAIDRSAWLLAAMVGDLDKSRLLLEAGVNVGQADTVGHNALHLAAETGRVEMVRWLVGLGMEVDGRNTFEETALMLAGAAGAADVVRLLLELGADPTLEGKTEGRAISSAANIECVRLLLEAGEDVDFIAGDGYDLLKTAAEENDVAFVRGLLAAGADPDNTSTGDAALHKAVLLDHLEIAEMLLAAGADPSQQDVDGWGVLH